MCCQAKKRGDKYTVEELLFRMLSAVCFAEVHCRLWRFFAPFLVLLCTCMHERTDVCITIDNIARLYLGVACNSSPRYYAYEHCCVYSSPFQLYDCLHALFPPYLCFPVRLRPFQHCYLHALTAFFHRFCITVQLRLVFYSTSYAHAMCCF